MEKKNSLVLGRGLTQRLKHTLSAETVCVQSILLKKKIYLSLHYNGADSYQLLFVNGLEIDQFKAKDSEIAATILCLGKISKDWTVDNMKKMDQMDMPMILVLIMMQYQLMIYQNDILDIHKYLMKKNGIV